MNLTLTGKVTGIRDESSYTDGKPRVTLCIAEADSRCDAVSLPWDGELPTLGSEIVLSEPAVTEPQPKPPKGMTFAEFYRRAVEIAAGLDPARAISVQVSKWHGLYRDGNLPECRVYVSGESDFAVKATKPELALDKLECEVRARLEKSDEAVETLGDVSNLEVQEATP